ncbi:hypothetical protein DYB26_014483 [Aphanomyces astaci]|uniref:Uncharacterized protein n=2 Tax=Aphanomyces astaci TaxID=112090 RepID=A0A397FG79_APHAT|nr:hypothetical protein DYB26_014483 [Aphanomyces astaci]RHZ31865.1 hypothetical protein DYB31_008914 [Aphanomyces astaci]
MARANLSNDPHYRFEQVQEIRSLLSKVLSDTFTQQFKDAFGEAQPVHLLWATIELCYEESNVNTVKTLVGQLI